MKYALLIVFNYPKNPSLRTLPGAIYDLNLALNLCRKFEICVANITVVTDLQEVLEDSYNQYNLKYIPYPSSIHVCREIAQFIENTIRNIDDFVYKSGEISEDEIFLYISGHGGSFQDGLRQEQGLILTNISGLERKCLGSRDLFNLFFGNIPVSSDGEMEIPIWKNAGRFFERETVTVQLSPIVQNSPLRNKRTTYLSNRGLPSSARMMILIDTCHSEHLTRFPYQYDNRQNQMIPAMISNLDSYEDLPFCVTIAACEENKKTRSTFSGSIVTRHIVSKLIEYSGILTIGQLYHLIIHSFLPSIQPIISSTSSNCDEMIPFFSLEKNWEVIMVEK